jgi:hypothetical protein
MQKESAKVYAIDGHLDAVIASLGAEPGPNAVHQAIVGLDFKTESAIKQQGKVKGQALAELIGLMAEFGDTEYRAPIVFTDFSTAIRIWYVKGSVIREILNAEKGPLSIPQALWILPHLIKDGSQAMLKYIAEKENMPILRMKALAIVDEIHGESCDKTTREAYKCCL